MAKQKTLKTGKKIVVVGGGTGIFPVLSGLKEYTHNVTAIVTVSDDGGSAGVLREEFGILPPGDIRRALIALAPSDAEMLAKLMSFRFKEGGGLTGHSFGNLIITALERITGSFEAAVNEASKILRIRGSVVPVTLRSTRLAVRLENGRVVKGETNIDIPRHDARLRIKDAWLVPSADLNSTARRAILAADAIVIGPGDLYTSIVPNLLVRGMREALKRSRATKIYCVNILTKFGETNDFQASDFVRVIERYAGANVLDYVLVNTTEPTLAQLRPYLREKAMLVKADPENLKGGRAIPVLADLIRRQELVRHDAQKTSRLIMSLI